MTKIKGFTLMEALVSILILSIVVLGTNYILLATYKQTDRAWMINNSSMITNSVYSIFTHDIRKAKSINVVDSLTMSVIDVNDKIIKFTFDPVRKVIYRNNSPIFMVDFDKIKNKNINLKFIAGTPKTRTVNVDFKIESEINDYKLLNGFASSFYCRNKE